MAKHCWSREKLAAYLVTYHRDVSRPILDELRNTVFKKLGGCCCCCGFSDKRALQIDHIHGGGVKELKKIGGGKKYLEMVLESITNNGNKYQLLCANCNWIKRSVNNENPGVVKNYTSSSSQRSLFDFSFDV